MNSVSSMWLLLDSREMGGIETHVYELALSMKNLIDAKVVFFNDYGEHPIEKKLLQSGIPYQKLDGRLKTLMHELKTQSPCVVHTHGYKAGIMGRALCKILNVVCVSTYHAGEKTSGKVKIYDFVDRLTPLLADQCFSVSEEIAGRVYGPSKLINNFVNSDISEISTGNEVAFVGRISEEKGPDIFCCIAKNLPCIDFNLYGCGPEKIFLERDFSEDNIIFHGFQDMTPIWSRIGLLVITSRFEGLPMAALEAMARGIPVVASKVGALPSLIEHGVNGWLVDVGDVDSYANIISEWVDAPLDLKQHVKNAAIECIQRDYTDKSVTQDLCEIYNTILKKKKVRREGTFFH